MISKNSTEIYVNEKTASKITGIPVAALRNYRLNHIGFNYIKIGRTVKYKLEDIFKYMGFHKIETD